MDALIEAARDAVRAAVQRASIRAVASEIGVSHSALATFVRQANPTDPMGQTRQHILTWAERRGLTDPNADQVSYFRGKQDALMGMMRYVIDQQAEIGAFLAKLRGAPATSATPPIDVAVADEEADILIAELKRRKAAEEARQKKRRRA